MKKKFDFSGLDAQQADSYETRESFSSRGSSSNSRVFDPEVVDLSKAIKFEPDKVYVVRFVPYEVDDSHPKVMQGKMKAGQPAYVLDYQQHVIGPDKTFVLCPKGTYGRSCPVCDKAFDLRQEDKESKEAKDLTSKRRVIYNVVLLSSTGKEQADINKVRLIAASQSLFELPMLEELHKGNEDAGVAEYKIRDITVGADGLNKALKIKTKTVEKGGMKFTGFDFTIVSCKDELDDDALLEQAVPLHKGLVTLSTRELTDIMYGEPSTAQEEEEPVDDIPVSTKTVVEEEEEDTDEPEPVKPVKAKEETGKCPYFGECSEHSECDDCPMEMYKACRKAQKESK